jgi:hypothetical protein
MRLLPACLFIHTVVLLACSSESADEGVETATRAHSPTLAGASVTWPSDVWSPEPGASWQWQLDGEIDTSFDVDAYDIDLLDTPQYVINGLHADGRVVICYFSAGSREEGREDANEFAPEDHGEQLTDWPNERWLDVRSQNVRRIMEQRLDLAVAKRCDAVEPDNVDGFQNNTGFDLTEDDQADYNRFLANAAHGRGLSVGLKNALDLIPELEPYFDWALNEECLVYDECEVLTPFIAAGKAVFHVEYVEEESDGEGSREQVCGDATIEGFSTLIKTYDLFAWRLSCDEA